MKKRWEHTEMVWEWEAVGSLCVSLLFVFFLKKLICVHVWVGEKNCNRGNVEREKKKKGKKKGKLYKEMGLEVQELPLFTRLDSRINCFKSYFPLRPPSHFLIFSPLPFLINWLSLYLHISFFLSLSPSLPLSCLQQMQLLLSMLWLWRRR